MKYTAETYAATLLAIASGVKLEAHAATLAGAGLGIDATAFVVSHSTYAKANAYSLSLSSVQGKAPKAAPTKAKGAIALAKAVDKHNKAFPEGPLAVVLLSTGEYTVLEHCPPKVKGKGKGKGSGGRMSAHVIADKSHKADGYNYHRECRAEGYTYILNGEEVAPLSQALYALGLPDSSKTMAKLLKYIPRK